jgi:hypothetical protein
MVPFSARARYFSLVHSVQTSFVVQPASYQMVTGALSPRVKQPGHEADFSPLSNAKIRNGRAIPALPIHLNGMVLN